MITVVIPAYNAAATLRATIQSAWEVNALSDGLVERIIVVNDGSSDDTVAVATEAGAEVISQQNAGPALARRRGVAAVRSAATLLLDADDQLVGAGVVAAARELQQYPETVAVVSATETVPLSGRPYLMPEWPEGITAKSLISRGRAPAPPAAVLWRTTRLRDAMGDDPTGVWPKYAEDFELLVRGALLGELRYSPVTGARYTWGQGRSSSGIRQEIADTDAIRRHYCEDAGVPTSSLPPLTRARTASAIAMRRASEVSSGASAKRVAWLAVGAGLDPKRVVDRLRPMRSAASGSISAPASTAQPPVSTTQAPDDSQFPWGTGTLGQTLAADRKANPRDPASVALLYGVRIAQYAIGRWGRRHPIALAATALSRLLSEFGFGVELRPATRIGPGLTIYHRFGLVVNDHAIIGANVTLRHGVTIGHQRADGPSPVIGDGVDVGASALILGGITVGDGARIAAGAVVVRDVAAGQTVAGNPAKPL